MTCAGRWRAGSGVARSSRYSPILGGMAPIRTRAAAVGVACALLVATVGGSSEPARARRGMVVASDGVAAEIGLDALRAGGSAVDAAVATAFALAVTLPAAGNIGGGGFLVHRPADGPAAAYDFRETAPAAASPEMFAAGGVYDAARHHDSHVAVGVPGTVAGLHRAWTDHGRLPWRRLVEPAIALARDGFVLSYARAASLAGVLPRMARYPASVAAFSNDGALYAAGDRFRQPDLAATLERVAGDGPAGFLPGSDRGAHRARDVGAGGARHRGRSGRLRAEDPCADPGNLSRVRGGVDAAAKLRRDHPDPDAQRPRRLRPAGRRPRVGAQRPPDHRGDAPRLRRPRPAPGGSRLQPVDAGAPPDVEGLRRGAARDRRRGPRVAIRSRDVRVAGGRRRDDPRVGRRPPTGTPSR